MIELIHIEVLSLVFFGVGNFDARYFFGSKISRSCIFWGGLRSTSFPGPFLVPPQAREKALGTRLACIMKLRRTPGHLTLGQKEN